MRVLVTGSNGLIGSEIVSHFAEKGHKIHGIDNNMRAKLFGPRGDTRWNQKRLVEKYENFSHHELVIRSRLDVSRVLEQILPDAIVHAAAQPSHDLAATRAFDDFDINAVGTLNLLEAFRRKVPRAVFVYLSTNKVYGYAPNEIELVELEKRWDYADQSYKDGIDEGFLSISQNIHCLDRQNLRQI